MEKSNKKLFWTITLILLLAFSMFPILLNQSVLVTNAQSVTANSELLKYEWDRPRGGNVGLTHFSAGPAPNSPDVLWQRKDISTLPLAFGGKLFYTVGLNILGHRSIYWSYRF